MKKAEREQARLLRQRGSSVKSIAHRLKVSKASVSVWVRDIELSPAQKKRLFRNGSTFEVIEARRKTRLKNTQQAREKAVAGAAKMLGHLSRRDLWVAGTALYWGEGGKTLRGQVRVSNADPEVIRLMMKYFRTICAVPELKFRGHVHTFSHLNAGIAEKYWSKVSGIPRTQFYKTYVKPSVASKNKKDSLPNGTFDIYVCDTKLFLTIMGWIRKFHSF